MGIGDWAQSPIPVLIINNKTKIYFFNNFKKILDFVIIVRLKKING